MPQPYAGPATVVKIKAQLSVNDTIDDTELGLIADAVNDLVRGLPIAQPRTRTITVTTAAGLPGITAALGTFRPTDAPSAITGPATGVNPIPASAILTTTSDTAGTLSVNATATATVAVTLESYGWLPRIDRASNMLGLRLWRRRDSPAGVASFAGEGAVYISRNDPDIAQLLGLGDYAKPMVG